MSDYEALLLQEQRNPNATILQFFLSKYDSEEIVAIIEGPDDQAFYFDFVADYFPDKKVFYFPCSGKSSLLALKDFLSSYELGFDPERLLFLADKDFDDYLNINNEGIFKTEFYSIENYFVNSRYFEYVLRKFSAGRLTNKKVVELVESFAGRLEAAVKLMIVPMAVLCAIRSIDRDADFNSISSIDLVKVSSVIEGNRGKRTVALRQLLRGDEAIEVKSVIRFARAFKYDSFNSWLRGKHGLQLVRSIVRHLDSNNDQSRVLLQSLSSYFGTEAFKQAKNFLVDIPSLRGHCLAL